MKATLALARKGIDIPRICGTIGGMKKRTSYTLSEQGKQLLAKLAEKYGISQTAMLEVLIREKAKQEKVEW